MKNTNIKICSDARRVTSVATAGELVRVPGAMHLGVPDAIFDGNPRPRRKFRA